MVARPPGAVLMEVLGGLLVVAMLVVVIAKALGLDMMQVAGGARRSNLMLAMGIVVIAELAFDPNIIGIAKLSPGLVVVVMLVLLSFVVLTPKLGEAVLGGFGLAVATLGIASDQGFPAAIGVAVIAVMLAWIAGIFRR
jgi:hypothetical protein